ncbi:MAG TPA: secretin N-terminal domain-containing protein, partial [Pirellulales bacterium]|nr:secretin N-terminal domain-containing protein [Pirellulales bacterium]
MSRLIGWLVLAIGVALCWPAFESPACAQDRRSGFGDGRSRGFSRGMRGFPFGGSPSGGQQPEGEKSDNKDEKSEEEKKKPEAEENKGPKLPEPVKRPTLPSRPADPRELDVGPDDDGLISFSFKGQPWPSVLEWLADISDMSLQWEEAPAGYLDLTTRGRYTVEEIHDLINSVLLSKGFTLLRNGDVLIVANLKHLDPSLVPRVSVRELDDRGNYELVKTFIDLDWLLAENAAEEIKPMLSPYGKVTPLKTTNRLEILESAGNLRRIHQLLLEEQSDSGQQRLVREFRLRHTRAAEVMTTLQTLLGIEPKKSGSEALDPRAFMAQQMMLAQQQQGQQRGGPPGKPEKESQVYLVVNARENSILANAPPDKMAIIDQAIAVVDVAPYREEGLLGNLSRMQVYRLSGVSPDTLVTVLTELGGLDPTTRLEVDANNRAIIAYAPLADHVLIRSLVEKLDGSGRRFEVIQLRMLSAEYVAGSIQTLMTGPEKTDSSSSYYSRRRSYFYGGGSDEQDSSDQFQVEADIEHNRLLLRANDFELAEVKTLLTKLGEIAPEGRRGYTTRVIPAAPGEDTEQLLRRLERVWPSVAPNPLEVEGVEGPDGEERRPRMRDRRRSGPPPASEPEASRRRGERPARESEARTDKSFGQDSLAQASRYRFAQDRRV